MASPHVAIGRVSRALLYGVEAFDPVAVAVAVGVLLACTGGGSQSRVSSAPAAKTGTATLETLRG